jgi:hypothetical protein
MPSGLDRCHDHILFFFFSKGAQPFTCHAVLQPFTSRFEAAALTHEGIFLISVQVE